MLDFQQKRKLRSGLYNRWVLYVLGIIVILAIHSTWDIYQKQLESQKLLTLSQEQAGELKSREAELQSQIANLQTPQGLEAEIRSKFNVAKPNENVAVVLDNGSTTDSTTTNSVSFWQKILDFLHF